MNARVTDRIARASRAAVSHYAVSAAEWHFTIKELRNGFEFRASVQPRAIKHAIGGNARARAPTVALLTSH